MSATSRVLYLSSIDMPVTSQILEASEEVPLLSFLLRLDLALVREILSRQDFCAPDYGGAIMEL